MTAMRTSKNGSPPKHSSIGLPTSVIRGGILAVIKWLLSLSLVFVSPSDAALLAHVSTDKGNITVDLQFEKAPQAVANFITLSEASRPHLDAATGAISNTPLYVGEKFFRVVNSDSFKIAQTGSGTGTNSGGPGYTFKDEFHPTLTHVPYVLSMANSGPNSNGSQIFFTGNVSIPSLNNVHTVFGLVTDAPSRAVVDAVLGAGNNGSEIIGITFQRTDPDAVAFDEMSQQLPVLTRPMGNLHLQAGTSATWSFSEPLSSGDLFRAFHSETLGDDWVETPTARTHIGIGAPLVTPSADEALLSAATAPRDFFNLSVAHHPDSVAPSYLRDRSIIISVGSDTIRYDFNADQSGGTTTYTKAGEAPQSFPFVAVSIITAGHDVTLITDHGPSSPLSRYFLIRMGCDSATESTIAARHTVAVYSNHPTNPWNPAGSGAATISR